MNPITVINYLTVKPGMIDPFLELQRRFVSSLTAKPAGLLHSRVYRSTDGKSVVLIRTFASAAAHEQAQQGDAVREHLKNVRQYLEESRKGEYEEVSMPSQYG